MSDPRTKIRALLVKAMHAGTPEHEAALSRQIAAQLCTKYGLDLAELEREAQAPVRDTSFGGFTYRPAGSQACARCGRAASVLQGMCLACSFDFLFSDTRTRRPAPEPGTGPRATGTATSTGKARLDHRGCSHEATPAARAKCRRERARQGL